MLAKLLIEVLCLGKDSADSNRLLNFKAPKAAKGVFIYFNSKYFIKPSPLEFQMQSYFLIFIVYSSKLYMYIYVLVAH